MPSARSTDNSAWDNRGDYVSIIGFDVDGSEPGSGTRWTHGIYTGGSYSVIEGDHVHDVATGIRCTGGGGSRWAVAWRPTRQRTISKAIRAAAASTSVRINTN